MDLPVKSFFWRALSELELPFRFEFMSPSTRAALSFSFRTWIAGICALYVAFQLQLAEPYWAGAAVWIVAQPTPGMSMSKAVYRIVGTLIGAVFGLIIVSFFSQEPELFVLALAVLIGACTIAANLLRNFRSYGAVLAGYTAAIVALAAAATPSQAFQIAMARATCNVLGICCAALFTGVLAHGHARLQVISRLKGALSDGARRAAFSLARRPRKETFVIGQHLIAEAIALDAEIDYAAAESSGFRIHANRARSILADIFGVISAARSLESLEARVTPGEMAMFEELRGEILETLMSFPQAMTREETGELSLELERLRGKVQACDPEKSENLSDAAVARRYYLDRVDDFLRQLECALQDTRSLTEPWAPEPRRRLDFHRDHRSALINGFRSFVAVILAGVFWIASGWSSGSGMLVMVAVTVSLFSTLPHPGRVAALFFAGICLATVCAFFCDFFVLNHVSGWYELGALIIGLVMIPAGMLIYFEKTRTFGGAFGLIFITSLKPTNPMVFNVVDFINNGLATLLGVGAGAMAYILIMPYDPMIARGYVMQRIQRGLENISRFQPVPLPAVWQSRMFDRINRLHQTSTAPLAQRDEWMRVGLGALDAGNEILRLRALGADESLGREAAVTVEVVMEKFGKFRSDPFGAVEALRTGVSRIREVPVPADEIGRRTLSRVRGSLEEMNFFFAENGTLFHA